MREFGADFMMFKTVVNYIHLNCVVRGEKVTSKCKLKLC